MPRNLTTIWAPFFVEKCWKPLSGTRIKVAGIDCLLSRETFGWFVSDVATGMRIAAAETQKAAIAEADRKLKANGTAGYQAAVRKGAMQARKHAGPRPKTEPETAKAPEDFSPGA